MTISYFNPLTVLEAYQRAENGAEVAAEESNAKLVSDGPTEATPSSVPPVIESMLASTEADGFAVGPCLPTAFTALYPKIVAAVPNENVLSYACPQAEPGEAAPPGATTYVGADQTEQIVIAIEAAVKAGKLPKSTTGTALLANPLPTVPVLNREVEAGKKAIERLLPKVEIKTFTSGLTPTENLPAWTSAFSKYPDVVFAVGAGEPDGRSLLVLKERGVGGSFVSAANSADSPPLIAGILDGKIAGGAFTDWWTQGNVATHLLIDGARGEPFPEGWIDTGIIEVTKANAAEYLAAYKSPSKAKEVFSPHAEEILGNLEANTKSLEQATSVAE